MACGLSEGDAWLEMARQGNMSAWSQVLDSQRNRLKRMVIQRLDQRISGRMDPSDVVQEVMMKATAQRHQYFSGPDAPVYAWLRQIAIHELVDVHRRHVGAGRRTVLREEGVPLNDGSTSELAQELAGRQSSPSHIAVRQELVNRVQEALRALPAELHQVLALKYLELLSTMEVAAVTGLSVRTVQLRHREALTRVAELLR